MGNDSNKTAEPWPHSSVSFGLPVGKDVQSSAKVSRCLIVFSVYRKCVRIRVEGCASSHDGKWNPTNDF